jgi:outer membrane autotransporter protein
MWRGLAALCGWGLISAGVTFAGATPALAESAGCATTDRNTGSSADAGNDIEQATKLTTTQTSALAVTNFSNFVNARVKSRFNSAPSPKRKSVSATDQADSGDELKQLASLLQVDMLVPAARQALDDGNFDRLLILGTNMADKALDVIGRPYGLWFRGASTFVDHEKSGGDYSGTELSLGGGADYRFRKDLLTGLAVSYERGAIDNTTFNTGDLTSEGATVAPYVGWRPIPELTLDANIGVGSLEYSSQRDDGAIAAQFDGLRAFGSLNGTGAFHFGLLRLSPTAGVLYFNERQDGYTDSSGVSVSEQTVSLGRLSSGMEIGYTMGQQSIGFGFEPYTRLAGEWDFVRPDTVALTSGETVRPGQYGANLAGGLNLFNGEGLSGKFEGSLDSIGRADYENFTVQGSVRYGF